MVFSGARVQNGSGGNWEDRSIHTHLNSGVLQAAHPRVSNR